jgi:hypothetical protein
MLKAKHFLQEEKRKPCLKWQASGATEHRFQHFHAFRARLVTEDKLKQTRRADSLRQSVEHLKGGKKQQETTTAAAVTRGSAAWDGGAVRERGPPSKSSVGTQETARIGRRGFESKNRESDRGEISGLTGWIQSWKEGILASSSGCLLVAAAAAAAVESSGGRRGGGGAHDGDREQLPLSSWYYF